MLTTLLFLLPPGRLKNRLLRMAGHDVHPTALIGYCFVRGVERFELAEGVRIGHGNVFRGIKLVRMGRGAMIHQFNWITGDSGFRPEQQDPEYGRKLLMATHAHIYSRHYVDCGGGIIMEENTWFTGVRSSIFTHSIDPETGTMLFKPVRVREGAMIAMCSTVLPGTTFGLGTFLAAGAVTKPNQTLDDRALYGGSPAKFVAPYKISETIRDWNRYAG
jgi:acetyltransferase-like isoleucine patch superfamily enzyme